MDFNLRSTASYSQIPLVGIIFLGAWASGYGLCLRRASASDAAAPGRGTSENGGMVVVKIRLSLW